ncbi:hypothetical protein KY348_05505 [Candidatus Woesearchaeota archaeon]|nr:hypothetical protein [Candidatus Woesearchaeota archaeon]
MKKELSVLRKMVIELLSRKKVELAEKLVDNWFYREGKLDSIESFLADSIDMRYQRDVKNEEEKQIRTSQNQFIQFLLKYVDSHPLSVRDGHTSKLRTLVWKYSGINCDDFSKLDIRGGVRFDNPEGGDLANFNPGNITILTGGKKVFITGLRGDTYLDGSGKIIIYGAFNCASGVSIFTHDHEFKAPDKTLWAQGRSYSNTIIYPECFIGEGVYVFGNLNFRNIIAPKTVTRLKKPQQPYALIGGSGREYRVIRNLELPKTFPPEFLKDTIANIKKYSETYSTHLESYVDIVSDFLKTDRTDWESCQEKIRELEAKLFKQIK